MDNLIASVALFTNPTVIARQIMAGLANGVLLFLVASGLSLIFGLSRIINFAHGALFMLGAYFAYSVVGAAQTDLFTFFLMLLASTVGLFIFGVAFEMAVLRRIYRSAQAFQLLVTFGLVLILSDAVRLIAGPAEKSVQLPVALEGFVRPFGVTFPVYRVALIAIGLSIGIGLWVLLYRTRWELWFELLRLTAKRLVRWALTHARYSLWFSDWAQHWPVLPAVWRRHWSR